MYSISKRLASNELNECLSDLDTLTNPYHSNILENKFLYLCPLFVFSVCDYVFVVNGTTLVDSPIPVDSFGTPADIVDATFNSPYYLDSTAAANIGYNFSSVAEILSVSFTSQYVEAYVIEFSTSTGPKTVFVSKTLLKH